MPDPSGLVAPRSPIVRRPLRDEAYDAILARIYEGSLAEPAELNDVRLAAALGISRTPVREALTRLALEGVLQVRLGHGYALCPLSAREASELYPVLWTLELLALRSAPPPSRTELSALRAINQRLASPTTPIDSVAVDAEWHGALLAGCTSTRLHAVIESQRVAIRRYEYAYMAVKRQVATSVQHHTGILSALRRGSLGDAARLLERHWRFGLDRVLGALSARPRPDA